MPLILGTTPQSNWQPTRNLFQQAGWALLADRPETWYQNQESEMASDNRYLLLHSHPEEAIARAIVEGKAPEAAVREWIAAAQAMVSLYKRCRRQAVMVFIPHLLANPQKQLEAIATHLGLPAAQLPETAPPAQELPVLEQMMASQLLRQTAGAKNLLAQIEACTLPLDGHSYGAPELDVSIVNQHLITLRNSLAEREEHLARLQKQLAEQAEDKQKAEEESRLLLEQLHLVQEELEAKLLENNQLQKALSEEQARLQEQEQARRVAEQALKQAKKQAETAQASQAEALNEHKQKETSLNSQLAELKGQIQHGQEENSLLLEQLHLVQEELETQFVARQNLDAELAEHRELQDHALEAANNQIRRLQSELNRFKSSATWKAMAPVRALKKPFGRNPAKKTIQKQVELIRQSGLFNEGWYLKNHPDVAESGIDPIEHYLKFGAEEHRNPSPEFDTHWYLNTYPDVAEQGINPLVHYIKFGESEGRAISAYHRPSLPAPGTVQEK